jgi:hypothetical protein
MYILQKPAVLDKLERRIRTAAITCHYSVNNVTIDLSIHTKTKPGKPLKHASKHMRKFLVYGITKPGFKKNEWAFCVWLDDEAQKGLSISADVVMKDTTKLYNQPKSMVVRRKVVSTPAHF